MLAITGDDYYVFHVNGAFVVRGRNPATVRASLPQLDVTGALQAGDNTLAAASTTRASEPGLETAPTTVRGS